MRLDIQPLRYLNKEEFRALTAIELGSRNHDLVPTALISSIAGFATAGRTMRAISTLHKYKLLFHESQSYDGYRLTYMGYDYLALKAMANHGVLDAVGRRIGVGKESDVFEASGPDREEADVVVKLHRLGRTSFRAVKTKRDYMGKRQHASWMFMSRLAAAREASFMKALFDCGFPVPKLLGSNRHCVVMSRFEGLPLSQIPELKNPHRVYETLMELILKFAEYGLVHGDFNEWNIMIGKKPDYVDSTDPSDDEEFVMVIDFPQMISTSHPNALEQFERDIDGVRNYFRKRYRMTFEEIDREALFHSIKKVRDLDKELKASGVIQDAEEDQDEFLEHINETIRNRDELNELSDGDIENLDNERVKIEKDVDDSDESYSNELETEENDAVDVVSKINPREKAKGKTGTHLDPRKIREQLKKEKQSSQRSNGVKSEKPGKAMRKQKVQKFGGMIKSSLSKA